MLVQSDVKYVYERRVSYPYPNVLLGFFTRGFFNLRFIGGEVSVGFFLFDWCL